MAVAEVLVFAPSSCRRCTSGGRVTAERQSYQQRVARLLEQIDAYSRKRLRLATAGARQPVLVPLDDKLALTRAQLEELIGASGRRGQF